MISKLEWTLFNISYRRLKSISSHRMLKRIYLERTLFKNKERHLPKRKVCPNSKEIFKGCSRISIDNRLWMQSNNRIRMIFKICYKRRTFSRTIIMICTHKNFTRKNKLILKKLKMFLFNKWKKLNNKKMKWVDKIFSIN